MIKLNNKNITYVALADSNNSLKAPKEIWYADSSNSVKLVYRRKDALIEGEDYEKYHWILTDTGSPHIQVAYNYNTDNSAYIETRYKCNYSSSGFDMIIGFSINKNNNIGIRIFNVNNKTYVDHHKTVNGVLSSSRIMKLQSNINAERYIKATLNNVIIDDTEYPSINWGSGFDAIDRRGTILYTNQGDNDVHYAETKLRVNNVEYDLIPCKLLKPVPKWLDANGIRRQTGECGMIDLVSGKFYGNVNSVGTFTVENYYERKEWLVGDGSAYIDTKVTSYTGVVSTKYSVIESELNDSNIILGRERADYTIDDWSSRLVFELNKSTGRLMLYSLDISRVQYLTTDTIDVDVVNDTFTTSTQSGLISVGDNVVGRNLFLFASNDGAYGQRPFHGKVAYLRITDKLNMIPCTLTMDLPASMDANNIARTKGTSGMWDLVSDKFYGNVANSGTFKAVNLAEGVDYEVHQWLITENSGGDLMMSLPLNTYDFSFKRRILELDGNCYHFLQGQGNALQYYTSTTHILRVHKDGATTFTSIAQTSFGDDIEIKSTNDSLTFNGESVPIPDSYFTYLRFKKSGAGTIMKISTSSIYVDGIERYIPVKLLKSIPSKYDANGIARQAGECGMYDTVNDVFYGNVASSGSFSCVNDS